MNAVEIKKLTLSYENEKIFTNLNLKIPNNKMCAIIGPNGAGKSTLFKAILGFNKYDGEILIFNQEVNLIKKEISYVPQKEKVNWLMPITVFDVVLMGVYPELGWFKHPQKNHLKKVEEALKRLDILNLKDKQIAELSGGQQQRVFLARALVQSARIYFLDEPFTGIDKKSEKIIVNLLKELQQEGKTIIVVHHDLNTIKQYFDYVVMINRDCIASGSVDESFNQDNINKTYGVINV